MTIKLYEVTTSIGTYHVGEVVALADIGPRLYLREITRQEAVELLAAKGYIYGGDDYLDLIMQEKQEMTEGAIQ